MNNGIFTNWEVDVVGAAAVDGGDIDLTTTLVRAGAAAAGAE